MNILGMGTLEIFVILIIAFIFLGPNRMVDASRRIGTTLKDLRRLGDNLPKLLLEDKTTDFPEKPITHQENNPSNYSEDPVPFTKGDSPESKNTNMDEKHPNQEKK